MTIPVYERVVLRLPSKCLTDYDAIYHLRQMSTILHITQAEAVGQIATASAYVVSQSRMEDRQRLQGYQLFDDYFPSNNFDGIIEAMTNDEGLTSLDDYDKVQTAFSTLSSRLIDEWKPLANLLPEDELNVDDVSNIRPTGEIDVSFHYTPKPFVV